MAKRQIILEMKHNRNLEAIAFAAVPETERSLDSDSVPKISGVKYDSEFGPAALPGLRPRTAMDPHYESGIKFDIADEPKDSTYIIRAEADESKIDDLKKNKAVAGVFADVEIQPTIICPNSAPMGSDQDVERLLCVPRLHSSDMNGKGVLVAIVDTGINISYLNNQGKIPNFDAARSWVPRTGLVPGDLPVGHGTMCAFDACIAAPKCTLLDIALLRSNATGISGVLSDAVRAYAHLLRLMRAPRRPGESRSMVVNNSWGMFRPSQDFPVGDPGNYSDNPNHPFNRIVASLDQSGADILFAAGNCGTDCPDNRCENITNNTIYGANGSSSVLCVAGVDTSKHRVGYSSKGPGRLAVNKPDISGYTHFIGSGVYPADGGTSAATPVVAGVVAAIRTKRPFAPSNPSVSPAAIRALLRGTAEDLGSAGYDFDHGFGVVNGCELYKHLRNPPRIELCHRFPVICRPRWIPIDLCRRFPQLCRLRVSPPPRPDADNPSTNMAGHVMAELDPDFLEELDAEDLLMVLIEIGEIGGHVSGDKEHVSTSTCSCHDSSG